MAILDPLPAKALAVRLIPLVAPAYARALGLRPDQRSLGLITADNDDALYVALDEATKMADVEVVYARSFYAGARHASGALSGEIIALLAGPDPQEVSSGLDAALRYLAERALWFAADAAGGTAFFPHVIARIGSYLAQATGLPPGTPVAYLVAPPLEGCYALDAALKAAPVELAQYTAPPSATNFMGAILTGDQSACEAAAQAFQAAVLDVAARPILF
jgi:ethanolamine utilization protein EutL